MWTKSVLTYGKGEDEEEWFKLPTDSSSAFLDCSYSEYEFEIETPSLTNFLVESVSKDEYNWRDIPFHVDDDFEFSKWDVDNYFQNP